MERAHGLPFRPLVRAVLQRRDVARRAGHWVVPPTPADQLGPAYRVGAPFRATLAGPATRGTPLLLEGRVLSAQTGESVAGALLEVWQTDARGLYSDLLGLARPGDAARMAFRARKDASDAGAYRLRTIVPGHYPLGPLSRPRHLHFRLTHPDYTPLVTQLYFEGDPLLRREPFATPPLRLSPARTVGAHGRPLLRAHFDFVLVPR